MAIEKEKDVFLRKEGKCPCSKAKDRSDSIMSANNFERHRNQGSR